jgi:hypothetical protein
MSNRKLAKLVHNIMEVMPEPNGGTAAWVDAVLQNDGELSEFAVDALRVAIASIVKQRLRSARDPRTQGKLFHSIEVSDGVSEDGMMKLRRIYRRALDVYTSVEDTDQVVDYYIKQHDAFGREANVTVKSASERNPEYQRELPFPELESGEEGAA